MDFSASALFANIVVSAVGCGLLMYGKKQRRPPQFVVGLLMLVYPYFVEGAWAIWGIAALLVGAVWLAIRQGL